MSTHAAASTQSAVAAPGRSPLLRPKMPGLDVLRGIAILAVVFYHGLNWSPLVVPPPHTIWAKLDSLFVFGWLGVFLFFVLSGFLITGILIDSKNKQSYWSSFYIKRALRILPPFLVVLVVIKMFAHATWPYLALCMFYLANMAAAFHITGFQYGVLWSLAVEEQFYLVWPSAIKTASRRALIFITIGILVLSPVLRLLSFKNFLPLGEIHSMTWLISDNLIAGAALAILLRSPNVEVRQIRKLAWILLIAGSATLLMGLPFGILHRTSTLGAGFQTVPFELIFASAVLFALFLDPDKPLPAILKGLQFFGYISYGLYLYHELIFLSFAYVLRRRGVLNHWSPVVWFFGFLVEATLAVVVAYLSRKYFEERFLRQKSRLAPSAT